MTDQTTKAEKDEGWTQNTGQLQAATLYVERAEAAPMVAPIHLPPEMKPPLEGHVDLPGGFIDLVTGETYTTAEVRELNGYDEEKAAATGDVAKALFKFLNLATVKIGDKQPTADDLKNMLAGDRESLLLAIRKATYGSTFEARATCFKCESTTDVVIDLDKDVEVFRLDSPKDATFEMDLPSGKKATVSLPTGAVQEKLAAATGKTVAERNTMLLTECVQKYGDTESLGAATARGMSLKDRGAVIDALADKRPGPRLEKLTVKCGSCEEEIAFPLNLVDLFQG